MHIPQTVEGALIALSGVVASIGSNIWTNRKSRQQDDKRAQERQEAADKERDAVTDRLRDQLNASKESDLRSKRIEAYAEMTGIAASVLRARSPEEGWQGIHDFAAARASVFLLATRPVRHEADILQAAVSGYSAYIWTLKSDARVSKGARDDAMRQREELQEAIDAFRDAAAREIGV